MIDTNGIDGIDGPDGTEHREERCLGHRRLGRQRQHQQLRQCDGARLLGGRDLAGQHHRLWRKWRRRRATATPAPTEQNFGGNGADGMDGGTINATIGPNTSGLATVGSTGLNIGGVTILSLGGNGGGGGVASYEERQPGQRYVRDRRRWPWRHGDARGPVAIGDGRRRLYRLGRGQWRHGSIRAAATWPMARMAVRAATATRLRRPSTARFTALSRASSSPRPAAMAATAGMAETLMATAPASAATEGRPAT